MDNSWIVETTSLTGIRQCLVRIYPRDEITYPFIVLELEIMIANPTQTLGSTWRFAVAQRVTTPDLLNFHAILCQFD